MKSHYRVVIVGGGVVGASIAYHLTRFGWSDVAILERSVLTAGSSWHAAGGYHALNADPNIASLQAYTIDVLSRLEQETGQATGLHMTGGITFACTPDRWEWLQAAYRVFQTMGIEDVRLMSPEEIKTRLPDHQRLKGYSAACGPTAKAMSTRRAWYRPMPRVPRSAAPRSSSTIVWSS